MSASIHRGDGECGELGAGDMLSIVEEPTCLTRDLYTATSAFGPSRVFLRKASSTARMIPASMVSRNTMKNTGTANTSLAIITFESWCDGEGGTASSVTRGTGRVGRSCYYQRGLEAGIVGLLLSRIPTVHSSEPSTRGSCSCNDCLPSGQLFAARPPARPAMTAV